MGKLVLAAKVTHVPSLMLSEETDSGLAGCRDEPIAALKELGRRAAERDVDSFVVIDTHWLSNFGYHVNANERHKGVYTSHEAPHMIQDVAYDLPGDPALGDAIAVGAETRGLMVRAHHVPSLPLEYGTIVPMHYMNPNASRKAVSIACPLLTSVDESRLLGEAIREAVEASDENVALIASGSLSHGLFSNKDLGPAAWTSISSEFNRQVDLRVLELWNEGRYGEFLAMLPDYARLCHGEGGMADTVMLFAALGWDDYAGEAEQMCPYFPSSGSGQITYEFHL